MTGRGSQLKDMVLRSQDRHGPWGVCRQLLLKVHCQSPPSGPPDLKVECHLQQTDAPTGHSQCSRYVAVIHIWMIQQPLFKLIRAEGDSVEVMTIVHLTQQANKNKPKTTTPFLKLQ